MAGPAQLSGPIFAYPVVVVGGPTGPSGPAGVAANTGATGPTGATGITGATWFDSNLSGLAPSNALGRNGDYYLDDNGVGGSFPGNVWNKQNGSWVQVANIRGGQGIQG